MELLLHLLFFALWAAVLLNLGLLPGVGRRYRSLAGILTYPYRDVNLGLWNVPPPSWWSASPRPPDVLFPLTFMFFSIFLLYTVSLDRRITKQEAAILLVLYLFFVGKSTGVI